MIFTAILTVMMSFFTVVLAPLPNWSIGDTTGLVSMVQSAAHTISAFDFFLPVPDMAIVGSLITSFYIALVIFKIVLMVLTFIGHRVEYHI